MEDWGDVELGWLGLWRLWGYAPASFMKMRRRHEEAHEVLMRSPEEWGRRRPGREVLARLRALSVEGEARARRALLAHGREELSGVPDRGWVLRREDDEVGRLLAPMGSGGPPYLYGVGSRELLKGSPGRMVTVVGSRRVDRVGAELALEVGECLASAGYCVLSGGALGVDTGAHEGALRRKGETAAVLGVGVDCVYPRRNEALFRRIVESAGCLISPFPLGTPPRRHHFPRRNELLGLMSVATVVVRARPGSGSLMTADAAWRYGREVMAMPADVGSRSFSGGNELLSRGASLVLSARGVLERLSSPAPRRSPEQGALWSSRVAGMKRRGRPSRRAGSGASCEELSRPADHSVCGRGATPRVPSAGGLSGASAEWPGVSGSLESVVVEALLSGAASVDELSRGLGVECEAVMRVLLSMELSGSVKRCVGGRYLLV